jgi:hypothetical protein
MWLALAPEPTAGAPVVVTGGHTAAHPPLQVEAEFLSAVSR